MIGTANAVFRSQYDAKQHLLLKHITEKYTVECPAQGRSQTLLAGGPNRTVFAESVRTGIDVTYISFPKNIRNGKRKTENQIPQPIITQTPPQLAIIGAISGLFYGNFNWCQHWQEPNIYI